MCFFTSLRPTALYRWVARAISLKTTRFIAAHCGNPAITKLSFTRLSQKMRISKCWFRLNKREAAKMRAHKFHLSFAAIIFLFFGLACSFKFGDSRGGSNTEISRKRETANGKIENRKNDAK